MSRLGLSPRISRGEFPPSPLLTNALRQPTAVPIALTSITGTAHFSFWGDL
jgi:hypothetical protein